VFVGNIHAVFVGNCHATRADQNSISSTSVSI